MVKSKVRFDGLDVAAMVAHWNRMALGRRVINIYNGPNGDTYLFKLDKISGSGEQSNLMLVIESGVRFHSTEQPFENPGMPSPYCSKLRKHLRGLRLENVRQLGNKDRVVHLVFGSGESQRHSLILEFYARGNIILTNSKFEILSLLRSHEYDNVKVAVGHVYPITLATTTTADTAKTSSSKAENEELGSEDAPSPTKATLLSSPEPIQWFQQQEKLQNGDSTDAEPNQASKSKKDKGGFTTKALLLKPDSGVSHYGPSLLDHCILRADLQSKQPQNLDESEWMQLQSTLKDEGKKLLDALDVADSKGYILYKPKPNEDESGENDQQQPAKSSQPTFDDKLLLEFQPHLLEQHKSLLHLEYESFDRAVDVFFSHIEGQKRMLRVEAQQTAAQQRLDKIKKDQEQRVEALMSQQELMKQQAQLVEVHAGMVENAIQVVNSALDSGMDWEQLEELIQVEQTQNQNPVALLIHKLELENDAMVLRLPAEDDGDDGEEGNIPEQNHGGKKTVDITISLKESAHGNASALFARYRASKEKSQKTIEASTKALQAAEATAKRQLQEAQSRKSNLSQTIQTKRKPLWFEKFSWFITSDNYLVIAGRDAQQNEQLVKRYLRPGDAYLHADVHGAASCILRAKRSRQRDGKTVPIPLSDQALREAGNFTICKSSAWKSRMVTSAWWVESHQVSKTAPSGEYLTVGSFMVRGKKNFLPPSQLEMGLAVLFKLGDEESVARHKNERRDFALMQLENQDEDDLDVPILKEEKSITKPQLPPVVEDQNQNTVERSDVTADNQQHDKHPENEKPQKSLQDLTEETQDNDDDKNLGQNYEEDQPGEPDKPDNEGDIEEPINENPPDKPGSAEALSHSPPHDNPESNVGTVEEQPDKSDVSNGKSVEQNQTKPTSQPKKKKGLSVRERKLIRKYGSLEAAMEAENARKKEEEQQDMSVASSMDNNSTVQPNITTQKRGKKAKMKRMQKKYRDQDDEDRELAMLALHAGEKSKKKNKNKEPEKSEKEQQAAAETIAIMRKDASKVAAALPDEVEKILAECVTVGGGDTNTPDESTPRWDKFDADTLEQLHTLESDEAMLAAAKRLLNLKLSTRIDNFSASLAGIIRTVKKYGYKGLETDIAPPSEEAKRKTKAEKEAESAAWKQTLAEEGVVDQDQDEDNVDDTIELSKLTGKPHPEDSIVFAVPVCAPYQTLSQYNYRVKLTPGNVKRGKAAKQAVDMFLKDGGKSGTNDRNRDLVKKVMDNEWVQVICADVKIAAPGASKVNKKQKQKGKKRK